MIAIVNTDNTHGFAYKNGSYIRLTGHFDAGFEVIVVSKAARYTQIENGGWFHDADGTYTGLLFLETSHLNFSETPPPTPDTGEKMVQYDVDGNVVQTWVPLT